MASTKAKNEIACLICSKTFYPRIDRPNNFYCSRQCFHTSTKGKYNGGFHKWYENGGVVWNKGRHVALNDCLIKWRKDNPSSWNKGKKFPQFSGENNPMWKGGITSENEKLRKSLRYIEWRTKVFIRDDFTCQGCGQYGGKLQVDHELPFSEYPDLRFEVLNGRTFCIDCHKKYGWSLFKTRNPRKQYA